jgi:hypothetical protein
MNYEAALHLAKDFARSQNLRYVVTVSITEGETERDTYRAQEYYRFIHFARYSEGIVTHVDRNGRISAGPYPLNQVTFNKSPYRGMIQVTRNDYSHMRDSDKVELQRRWREISV